jgi:imidazolonepropionase-like amidohydrolase
LTVGHPVPLEAQAIAITNARIHPIAGPVIPRGTVVIEGGRITAVGPNVAVPDGARVIDASGKVVTPGFLDNASTLGLVEIDAEPGTNDMSTSDDAITAAFTVVDAINPLSTLIPVTRVEGITRAVVQPQNGASLIAGTGALIDLGGDRVSAILHRHPTAMYAVLGESGAARAGGSRGAAALRLREALEDARDYAANRAAYAESRRRDYALSRLDLEALVPVVEGAAPLAVGVHRASDILVTLRLAQDFGLRLILMGVAEGWTVAGDIAGAGVPVVMDPMQNIPQFERLATTLENAARLDRAGVNVAFATFDAHNSRTLKQLAGNAVAYGMPYDAALRAVTVNGARIWGIDDRYGTLEVGRDADVVVWAGDPFELATTVEHVFIRGREMSKNTRQRELLERYRSTPTRP